MIQSLDPLYFSLKKTLTKKALDQSRLPGLPER